MTLVSEIIRDAYRESNLIAIGTEPTSAQSQEGLRLLRTILDSVYGFKAGELLRDFVVGKDNISRPSGFPWYNTLPDEGNFFVPPNCRLIFNIEQPLTLYLNPTPQDGERFSLLDKNGNFSSASVTIEANGRTIGGEKTEVFSTDGTNVTYIYRSDLGDWTVLAPIETASTWPFPSAFDDMFRIMLAMRLNPRNDTQTSGESIETLREATSRFRARYAQSRQMENDITLTRLSSDRYRYYDYYSPDSVFNSGYVRPFGGFLW